MTKIKTKANVKKNKDEIVEGNTYFYVEDLNIFQIKIIKKTPINYRVLKITKYYRGEFIIPIEKIDGCVTNNKTKLLDMLLNMSHTISEKIEKEYSLKNKTLTNKTFESIEYINSLEGLE